MKLLEDRILNEGEVLKGNVLKVDGFLNHQIDPELMKLLGDEFARLFKDSNITKILTIEVSGIAPSLFAGMALNVPVVFARKHKSITMDNNQFSTTVHSYTKNITSKITVSKNYLQENDNVLIIDDFLANGQAGLGLIEICKQAKANVKGLGIVIEKSFQPGRQLIEETGTRVESLARIESFMDGKIIFKGE